MPSSKKAIQSIIPLIPSNASSIYELGSGWGALAVSIAKNRPSSTVHAFEISPIPYLFSRIRTFVKNLIILRGDFFNYSICDADVVVCYLYPEGMRKLKKKFENELKSGTVVISNSFSIFGWKPINVVPVGDLWNSLIYIYVI